VKRDFNVGDSLIKIAAQHPRSVPELEIEVDLMKGEAERLSGLLQGSRSRGAALLDESLKRVAPLGRDHEEEIG